MYIDSGNGKAVDYKLYKMKVRTETMKTAKLNTETASTFETVKRAFENAYINGDDVTDSLTALAQAVALSVVKKCIDPQSKTAQEREAVSDNGVNPAMVQLRREIISDRKTLENDVLTVSNTIGDGLDLVNTAIVAILEQTERAQDREPLTVGYLDKPFIVRKLDKRVYIQLSDSAKFKEVETAPILEVYKAVRNEVQRSRAIQTDPRNGYTYIEELITDPTDPTATLDSIYYRLDKYADLGGYDCNGNYTADRETANRVHTIVGQLKLNDRQATILKLRLRGYGYKAIASYLGIDRKNCERSIKQIQTKLERYGITADSISK